MTESPPAGWYPGTDDYLRYGTGDHWSKHTAPAGRALPSPDPSARVASGAPRSALARTLLSVVMLGSLLILANRTAELAVKAQRPALSDPHLQPLHEQDELLAASLASVLRKSAQLT